MAVKLTITEDPKRSVKDVDYSIRWVLVSMGGPDSVWEERIKLLTPYRVDSAF